MGQTSLKSLARLKRKLRLKKKIRGNSERPRLSIFISGRHIYAQIINDEVGETLVATSTLSRDVLEEGKPLRNKNGAEKVGKTIAELALQKNIKTVVFDRNGYLYHGKIKVLADSARNSGLEF